MQVELFQNVVSNPVPQPILEQQPVRVLLPHSGLARQLDEYIIRLLAKPHHVLHQLPPHFVNRFAYHRIAD
jgi:hypothetical protein